jgi:hypothetical protein
MKISWFSAGVSSFCATLLAKDVDRIVYTHIDDQHEDSMRFLRDSEAHFGQKIEILGSRYGNVDSVIRAFRYVNGPGGAKCTDVLKRRVRKEFEAALPKNVTYVWGMDVEEKARADRLVESMPQYNHEFPLIDANMTKADCHGMAERMGIKRPAMYDMGYPNNNCIGCVKGGMGYWNMIRRDFPEVFAKRAETERLIGRSCINGVFLDELNPDRGRTCEVMPDCSLFCELAMLGGVEGWV